MVHSVALVWPSPSQSNVANGLLGFNAKIAQISVVSVFATAQSSAGFNGSPPFSHSMILLIPPLSQSANAIGLIGFAIT